VVVMVELPPVCAVIQDERKCGFRLFWHQRCEHFRRISKSGSNLSKWSDADRAGAARDERTR
jgi:hypothetical protein